MDSIYTGGVIAVKEKNLLKDRLLRLCEMSAEEAFRALVESGFGSGADAENYSDAEALVSADERDIDEFIREYSPSAAESVYLLSPRDFHNAKALLKAEYLSENADGMLAPEGLVPVQTISQCLKSGDYSALPAQLSQALKEAAALLSGGEGAFVSGAKIGAVFKKAEFSYLSEVCRRGVLKKFVAAKADMTNILTAMRSPDAEFARQMYVAGGNLPEKTLDKLFDADFQKASSALADTQYKAFAAKCFAAKEAKLPFTEAEKALESFETDYLSGHRFELKAKEPFLYYVFRRRAENADVRIIFVCLAAGMKEAEIKNRLRTF